MGVQWCIKFHPVEIQKYKGRRLLEYARKALGKENWANIIDLSAYALPAILLHTSYHVTGFSAATFETSEVGIKTGFWDRRKETQIWFADEIHKNKAELLPQEALDIANTIRERVTSHNPIVKP